jgi:hypothetical protein
MRKVPAVIRAARAKVLREINSGRMKRLPCCECGKEPTEAHHTDYSKPLNVVFLCRNCHAKKAKHFKSNRRPLT